MVTEAETIDEPGPRILYVNKAFTETTGYSKEETLGRSPRFLQGKRTDRKELDKIRNALTNNESVQVEIINYTKSGKEFWVNFSLIPIWKNNRITHFASIQRETTVKRNLLLLITSILDAIPEKVAFVDTQGKIKASNKEWKEYCYQSDKANTDYLEVCNETFGLTFGDVEIIGKGLKDVTSGKIEFFKKEIKHVAKTSQSFDILINPVNKVYPTDVVVLHIDITQRILSEERLQSSEEYYKSLFAHHPDAICSVDLEGKFTSVNDAVVNLTKIPKSKLLGSSFVSLIEDKSLKELLTLFNKVLQGEPQNLETEVLMKNGHSCFLNITSIPIKVNKKVTGLHSIIKDVTEAKQSQRKIAEVANRLTVILESITDGFFALDRNHRITYWNKEAERLMKIKREQVLGKDMFKSLQGYSSSIFERLKKTVEENIPAHYEEFYEPLGIWLEVSAYPSEEGLSAYFRDISVRKKTEEHIKAYNEQLEKTNHELDQFVYRASHDLRAPLVSILGLISIFRLEKNDEKKEEYLNLMVKSINKLDLFIQDIISYSKNSRTDLVVSKIDFNTLIDEVLENIKYMEEAKSIKISKELETDYDFYCDANRLNVILNNLISNAIRYHDHSKKDKHILIKLLQPEGSQIILRIEDNGTGIAKKDQGKIFEMFYRATQKNVGSGLGLYIVNENIKKLKGKIEVISEVGIGTTFLLTLPNLHEKPTT
jgi:PAS domain S-box-containing protein